MSDSEQIPKKKKKTTKRPKSANKEAPDDEVKITSEISSAKITIKNTASNQPTPNNTNVMNTPRKNVADSSSPDKLSLLLRENGFGHYEENFRNENVDFKMALDLNDEDLKTIGVKKLGDRKKMLQLFQLKKGRPEVIAALTEWKRVATSWFLQTRSSLEQNVEKRLKLGYSNVTILEIVKVFLSNSSKPKLISSFFRSAPDG